MWFKYRQGSATVRKVLLDVFGQDLFEGGASPRKVARKANRLWAAEMSRLEPRAVAPFLPRIELNLDHLD